MSGYSLTHLQQLEAESIHIIREVVAEFENPVMLDSIRFVEVYVNAPIETCRERDSEGMYSRADAGEIADYPGLTAPYEVSASPDLSIDTGVLTVDECVERIVDSLVPCLSVTR